jgi:hypothetical protein
LSSATYSFRLLGPTVPFSSSTNIHSLRHKMFTNIRYSPAQKVRNSVINSTAAKNPSIKADDILEIFVIMVINAAPKSVHIMKSADLDGQPDNATTGFGFGRAQALPT